MKTKLVMLFFIFILFSKPCQAITKCYKDICVGQTVMVSAGIYKGNYAKILDILKERMPDDAMERLQDNYKYFVSFMDGEITYLYRNELKIKE